MRVMQCESGYKQTSIGDTHLTFMKDDVVYGYSVGLMQIRRLPGRPEKEWLLDPENNVRYAAGMWKSQGWAPWTCATRLGIK